MSRFVALPHQAAADPRLGDATFRVLALYAAHADPGRRTWLSPDGAAAKLGRSRRGVRRDIARLEEIGYLIRTGQRRGRGGSLERVVPHIFADEPVDNVPSEPGTWATVEAANLAHAGLEPGTPGAHELEGTKDQCELFRGADFEPVDNVGMGSARAEWEATKRRVHRAKGATG